MALFGRGLMPLARGAFQNGFSSVAASGIESVTVVGAGTLGTQVAFQTAISGFQVTVLDVSAKALSGSKAIHEALAQSFILRETGTQPQARGWAQLTARPGNLDPETLASRALERITYTTSAQEAMQGCDLVSENVPEVPEIKEATYRSLKEFAAEHTIFTTNSSTLLPSEFAECTGRPSKFCALHFANGIWDANIGEVMPHPGTDPETVSTVLKFARDIQMVPFHIRKEQNGYLINSVLVPFLNASQSLVTNGVSIPEDVDKCWLISMGGYNASPGEVRAPFMVMDIIGLPIVSHIFSYWGEKLGDEQMKRNAAYLKEKYIDRGRLGIMNGDPKKDKAEGVYTYPSPQFLEKDFLA